MKLTIREIKKAIRESLMSEGEIDYAYISSDIIQRLEGEQDLSQAVTSFLKDNPNASENDVAKALKIHPISGEGAL
tara:strand:+ start:312 stop:539 length:228 start_codon:yes stop_codon:yes gene_type:complete